ncbi:MAG: hypothetical protein ACTSU5_06120 [Promethearchaeota archaeon]
MRARLTRGLAAIVLLLAAVPGLLVGSYWAASKGETTVAGVVPGLGGPKVLAFYYTWYGNTTAYDGEPTSAASSWVHWNENVKDAAGNPLAPTIAGHKFGAAHVPELGLFDSFDNDTIDAHLGWVKQAGIDALVCTWWGCGDWTDLAFAKLLRRASETGAAVEFTVYFESVQERFRQNRSEAVRELEHVLDEYGDHPNFLKIGSGGSERPVVFTYAAGYLGGDNWAWITRELRTDGYDSFVVGDVGDPRSVRDSYLAAFDGLHVYNPVGIMRDDPGWSTSLKNYYASMVHEGHANGKLVAATVIPGYNDLYVRDGFDFPRGKDGQVYSDSWKGVLGLNPRPDWVLITTFNEWHEGSEIEPSLEYGDLFIKLSAMYSAQFKDMA